MIVNVTRGDLRDESIMAHEAFALSPISARATKPSEEDYDAISAAFMETARGRWFLGEFAKRNRNADTRLVLDAVARVEQTLAAQNQPDPDSGRAEALAAIRAALNEARVAAALALDSLALEDNLAPLRKGARIIKEISWRWREIGADGRICDLIDSQLNAIEASCSHISSVDPRSALSAAFDRVNESIAAFDEDDQAASEAAWEAVSSPSSNPWAPPSDEMLAAATARGRTATGEAEAAVSAQAMPAEAAVATVEAAAETIVEAAAAEAVGATANADVTAEAADVTANTEAGVTTGLADMTVEAAEAHDDAVLDLIAAEMAAPDPSGDDLDTDSPETYLVSSSPTEIKPIAATTEVSTSQAPTADAPATPAIAPAIQPPLPASLQPSFEPPPASASDAEVTTEVSPETSPEVSLGSTLIANGIVRRPATSATDSLAAIRRLSQAEKIALFS
jgi:hypothetical protein